MLAYVLRLQLVNDNIFFFIASTKDVYVPHLQLVKGEIFFAIATLEDFMILNSFFEF